VGAWGHSLRAVYLSFSILVYAGLPVFLFARRLGVFLMLAGVIGLFATRLGVGIVSYRQTMRRPWPKFRLLRMTRTIGEAESLRRAVEG